MRKTNFKSLVKETDEDKFLVDANGWAADTNRVGRDMAEEVFRQFKIPFTIYVKVVEVKSYDD